MCLQSIFQTTFLLLRTLTHIRCKHVAALLLGLVALKKYSHQAEPPPLFKRPGMKRFKSVPDYVLKQVGGDLTWKDIISNLIVEPEKKREGRANVDTFQTAPKTKKQKKGRGTAATLEGMTVNELKKILVDLKLPTTGKKVDLIKRIDLNRPIPPSEANPASQVSCFVYTAN